METPDERAEEIHVRVLREMVSTLPQAERPAALLRLVDEIERLHRENAADVPAWIEQARERFRREAG
jgi:hypothetical protein